jgi:hypothetical protein
VHDVMKTDEERGRIRGRTLGKILFRQILDLLLYLSFCLLSGTGLLIALRLPPGFKGGHGLTVLGLSRHEWGDLHTWIAYLFIALLALHLAVNWSWLVKCAASGRLWRLALGLGAGMLVICAFFVLPVTHGQ